MGRGGNQTDSASSIVAARGDEFADQRQEAIELLAQEPLSGHQVSLMCLTGSRAYGMAHDGSDADYRGFYLAPSERFLGLGAPQEQLEKNDPDLTIFEIAKFCRLAQAANPNVFEVLYAPVMCEDEIGSLIRENRRLFLSQRVRTTYTGYAHGQFKKLQAKDVKRPEKREKFARHLFRLFEQGHQLLAEGDLTLRVSDPERLRELSKAPLEVIKKEFDRLDAEVRGMSSSLPEKPDYKAIDKLVREIRLEDLAARGSAGRA